MLMCCAFFSPHIVLCVPSKQLNFSLICPQNICPEVLWNIQVLFCELQTCSNVFLASSMVSSHEHASLFSVLHIVDSSTEMLACFRDFCKSLADTLGFFLTPLSILRCALAVISACRPLPGRVATVNRLFVCPWTDEHQGF
jgi:hypothetical protein